MWVSRSQESKRDLGFEAGNWLDSGEPPKQDHMMNGRRSHKGWGHGLWAWGARQKGDVLAHHQGVDVGQKGTTQANPDTSEWQQVLHSLVYRQCLSNIVLSFLSPTWHFYLTVFPYSTSDSGCHRKGSASLFWPLYIALWPPFGRCWSSHDGWHSAKTVTFWVRTRKALHIAREDGRERSIYGPSFLMLILLPYGPGKYMSATAEVRIGKPLCNVFGRLLVVLGGCILPNSRHISSWIHL